MRRLGQPGQIGGEQARIGCPQPVATGVLQRARQLAPARGGEPYYLGFFMTGAYQDSLANSHNLFGRCHEVIVRRADEEGVIMGSQGIDFNEQWSLEGHALRNEGDNEFDGDFTDRSKPCSR